MTLSACETALGKVANGDDVVGFTRGFLYAGASAIVSSLWKVDVQATSILMQQFYKSLKEIDMNNSLVILILVGTGISAVVCMAVFKAWNDNKKQRRALTEIAGRINAVRKGKTLSGQRGGFRLQFHYRSGFSDSRLPGMYIALEIPFFHPNHLLIYKDSPLDKIAGAIGFSQQVNSGYAEFDRRWHLTSTNPNSARQWLNNTKNRDAVDRLMGLGCSLIRIEKKRLIAEWINLKESSAFTLLKPDLIDTALDQMVEIGHTLTDRPVLETLSNDHETMNRRIYGLSVLLPFIILVSSAICYLYAEWHYYPLNWRSVAIGAAPYSLALLVLQLLISIRFLRGMPAAHYLLLAVLFMSCIGYPLGGAALTTVINGARDHSHGIWREAQITGKHTLFYREFTLKRHRLKVVLSGNSDEIEVPVSANLFSSLRAHRDRIRLLIRPGYFGYPWLAGIEKSVTTTGSGYSLRTAWDLQHSGQPAAALKQFSGYISAHPDNAKGYYYRGRLYTELKRFSDSLADMRLAIKLDPHYFDAYRFIDWLLARDSQWDEIIDYWSKLIQLEPGNARAYHERGGTYWHKGNMVAARKDLKTSCKLGYRTACKDLQRMGK